MYPVAILAGGLATRLRPMTEHVPKALLEVAGRPFAEHQLELLARRGVREVVFCIGHHGEQIEHMLGDGSRFGLRVRYAHDGPTLLGTGGALRRAQPVIGAERFFVLYGDSYLECDYSVVAQAFRASRRLGLMTVYRNDGRLDTSNVQFEHGSIVRYDKRARSGAMRHIDYGLSVLRRRALDPYPTDQAFDLAQVFRDLIDAGELAGFEVHERFYEIGSAEGLRDTEALLKERFF